MKTILIIGAGASCEYGFPLGRELPDRMREFLRTYGVKGKLDSMRFPNSLVEEFIDVLSNTTIPTVDQLLSAKGRFRDVGRYLIYEVIRHVEHNGKSKIFPSKGWYRALYQKLIGAKWLEGGHELVVITFNYDRSLEYFLSKISDYDTPDHQVDSFKEAVSKIRFIHPHGSLGDLSRHPYGELLPAEFVSLAVKGLRIIGEEGCDAAFEECRKEISGSDRILIGGFGYHQLLLKYLFGETPSKGIVGTAHQLDAEMGRFLVDWSRGGMQLFDLPMERFVREKF